MSTNVAKEAARAAGSQTALAKALGCTPQNIQHMCAAGRVPAKHVLKIEAVTGIPRSQLRPDIYPPAMAGVDAILDGPEAAYQDQKTDGDLSSNRIAGPP